MIDHNKYPHLSGKRVKFFTRSFSLELYRLSSRLYVDAGLPCVRLTDQTADGYFCTMLNDSECDVAINVDEDCFITDLDAVLSLADWTLGQGYVNAGCSDAALGCPRGGNAMVTNPFFNVFDLAQIRARWESGKTPALLKAFAYEQCREALTESFEQQMSRQKHQQGFGKETIRENLRLEVKRAEPYYNFFFWLMSNFPGKTFYLNNVRHADGLTTIVRKMDVRNNEAAVTDSLALHTWYARFFHPSPLSYLFEGQKGKRQHTDRIDAIINSAYEIRGIQRPHFAIDDYLAFAWNGVVRWSIKVPQRIAGWPDKLKRRFAKQ